MQKSKKVPKSASKKSPHEMAAKKLPGSIAAKKLPTLKNKTQALPAKSSPAKSVVKAGVKKASKATGPAKKVSAPTKPVLAKDAAKKSATAAAKSSVAAVPFAAAEKESNSANRLAKAAKEGKSNTQSTPKKALENAPEGAPDKLELKSTKLAGKKVPLASPLEAESLSKADAKVAKSKKAKVEDVAPEPDEEIVLLDAEGRRYCRVRECDQASAVDGYCRFHYLLFWKNIQVRKKILSEGKLERYIEELTARYPDKYLEMLKKDLRSDKEFLAAIQELEIDESSVDNEYEDEAQNYLDEVRGMSSETGSNDRDEEF